MEAIRLIRTDATYADFSTSLSPAVELALEKREAPHTVVLDIFRGGSFTVGVLEDPEKSLDLDYCRQKNIVVRRRQNPGGAIWGPAGGGFFIYYLDTRDPQVPLKSVREAFERGLTDLAKVINRMFNIPAVYRPLNDIEVEGRKLVPTSARLENGILTLRLLINLVPTDRDILTRAIKVAPEKIQDKKIKEVGARFTCLEAEIGRKVTDAEIQEFLGRAVKETFGQEIKILPGELTDLERQYEAEYQKKYTSDEWFYANSEKFRFRDRPPGAVAIEGRHKAPAGLIRVTLLMDGQEIKDLIITGDFHPSPLQVIQDIEQVLRGKPGDLNRIRSEIAPIFDRPDVEIPGTSVEDFLAAFRMALSSLRR
jgi:lipoate-protein ligase A